MKLLALLPVLFLTGCAALLPKTANITPSKYAAYDDAAAAVENLTPGKASRAEVHLLGFDPKKDSGLTVLTYADVLSRFPVAGVSTATDTSGIRKCVAAEERCSGYLIIQRFVNRDRVGNFWLDSFRFRQEIQTAGWSITAFILFVDDTVVFRQVGGSPVINELEVNKNPLGPLQGWGDKVVGAIVR